MVKVLIYSSKEIYDNAPYEGRAEADVVAYRRDDDYYEITKNRTGRRFGRFCLPHDLEREFTWMDSDELDRELNNYQLAQRYVDHPNIELSKNAGIV